VYRITIDFHKRLQRGEIPILFCVIHTALGYRAYAKKELSVVSDMEASILGGSWLLDGSVILGSSLGFLEKSARLLSVGSFDRTIQPKKQGLLLAYTQKQQQNVSVSLVNVDRYFSRLIVKEPFLTRDLYLYLGFEALPFNQNLEVFKGVIEELAITSDKITLEAVEA